MVSRQKRATLRLAKTASVDAIDPSTRLEAYISVFVYYVVGT